MLMVAMPLQAAFAICVCCSGLLCALCDRSSCLFCSCSVCWGHTKLVWPRCQAPAWLLCLPCHSMAWHGMLDMLSVSMCLPAGLLSSINAYLLACSDACFQGYVACRSVCASRTSRLCLVKDDFLCLLALLVTKTICLRLFKVFQSLNDARAQQGVAEGPAPEAAACVFSSRQSYHTPCLK
jgi:hypothetical protein